MQLLKPQMDRKGIVDINIPNSNNGNYLWKYLDLHKLLDFINSGQLHFNRLDLFEDPIEGLPTSQLRKNHLIESNYNKALERKIIKEHPNLEEEILTDLFISPKQKQQFVSCWFHDERESMAMWNLYSNRDSVAVKVKTNEFLNYTIEKGKEFIESHGYRLNLIGDIIEYLKLNPFDPKLPKQKRKYAAFKKDLSYRHEQEYRLLIFTHPKWIEATNKKFFKFPFDFNQVNIEIICHPLMPAWKRTNIKNLIKNTKLNIEVSKSSITLRNNST